MFIGFADGGDGVGIDAEETRGEFAGGVWVIAVDDGGGGGDACGVVGMAAAEGAESADEAGGFCALGPGEGVCFVEGEEVESGVVEEFDVALACEEKFELFDVGEEDAWLATGAAHFFAGADFFGGIDCFAAIFGAIGGEFGFVVGAGGALWEANAGDFVGFFGCLADIHAEGDAGPGE